LQIASAILAFIAAWFWMQSAMSAAPEMAWDNIAQLKPWLDHSAMLNRIAGMAAAVSAMSNGAAFVAMRLERRGFI
jgi:hypothetical protein